MSERAREIHVAADVLRRVPQNFWDTLLTPAGNGKYTLDLTSCPQATYLLTLVTTNGKQHTLCLLK